jgi:cephalosporin-C deacetylase-like acetyl esterase
MPTTKKPAATAKPSAFHIPWDMNRLSAAPAWEPDPTRGDKDMKAVFYEGVPWRGKPTKVFAYYAIPKVKKGETVPAMVLIHGGGGSAFIPWVRLWLDRGYAAISMDCCGCTNGGAYDDPHERHEQGGPAGWGGFNAVDEPVEDQWTYHAVAAAILGHSLIRSFPQVDAERIGLTGISWGGYTTCVVAGADQRFKFAAPVYGCGFLDTNSAWLETFANMGAEKARKWLRMWDPSMYLPHATMPMLWVTGTNDFAYPMDALQPSYRLPKAERTLAVRVRMPHAHGEAGEAPPEILAMGDHLFRGKAPLARITKQGTRCGRASVEFESEVPVVGAEFNWTSDTTNWMVRNWETAPAALDAKAGKASAKVPPDATGYYINLIDDRGCVVSSEHVEVAKKAK